MKVKIISKNRCTHCGYTNNSKELFYPYKCPDCGKTIQSNFSLRKDISDILEEGDLCTR